MLEIVGDSHTNALIEAASKFRQEKRLVSRHGEIRMGQLGYGYHFLEPFFACEGEDVRFTQDVASNVFAKLNPESPHVIQPNDARRFVFVFGLYPSFGFNAEHWQAHSPAIGASGRQFVSASAFAAIVDQIVKPPLAFFERLQAMNVRFSVASCCPIPSSYSRLARKTNFIDGEIALIYSRFRDHVCRKLDRVGVVYHLPPAEVYDDSGSMLDEYAKSPADYHANAAYGSLMLAKILREVDQLA
jgi:hypothetical protein